MPGINIIFTWLMAISGMAGLLSLGGFFASWLAVETLVLLTIITA